MPNTRLISAAGPASKATVVDVSAADQTLEARAFYVGGAGDLAVRMEGGEEVVFVGVGAGTILPIAAVAVLQTGTSATNVIALA